MLMVAVRTPQGLVGTVMGSMLGIWRLLRMGPKCALWGQAKHYQWHPDSSVFFCYGGGSYQSVLNECPQPWSSEAFPEHPSPDLGTLR